MLTTQSLRDGILWMRHMREHFRFVDASRTKRMDA